MTNIAIVLKEEIIRLARKELRGETAKLKKTSAQYRSEIAALKRRISALEKQCSSLNRNTGKKPLTAKASATRKVRFTAKGLRTLRQRLGLSANDLGKLIGVTAQSIYSWEAENTRPREQQIASIATLRGIGKKEASARLAE
jgi:DNA-binding transcriptional regulator YiaG